MRWSPLVYAKIRGIDDDRRRDRAVAREQLQFGHPGVDWQRVGQSLHSDTSSAQVVDQVQRLAQVPAEPVERVHDDGVALAGIVEQRRETITLRGGAALLVDI